MLISSINPSRFISSTCSQVGRRRGQWIASGCAVGFDQGTNKIVHWIAEVCATLCSPVARMCFRKRIECNHLKSQTDVLKNTERVSVFVHEA